MTAGPLRPSFGSVDPLLVLLAKQIEVEQEYQRHEDGVRVASRNAKLAADEAQVRALLDQADAIEAGAWVSLGFTAAGGLAEGASIATSPDANQAGCDAARRLSGSLAAGGRVLSASAEPAGKLVGDATVTKLRAREAISKSRGDDAESSLEGAQSKKLKSEKHADALIEQIERIIASARQALDHVLSRF